VLDVAESVPVCTSETERDVRELSGTLVEKGGDSGELGSVVRTFSVIMAVVDAIAWLSATPLVERSRAVTDSVELPVELARVRVAESIVVPAGPASYGAWI
jgi:hypothetical protein